MENNNFDIFNLPTDAFINPTKVRTTEIYSPSADKGKEGVYKALIRFLPNPVNPVESKLMKYYVWLTDPSNGEGFSVDCPSTKGQKSILKDMYWKLKKSESVKDQEIADKQLSRVETYYSLVQIVKDPNAPELEGKIMVFKFGTKINQKIEAQLKPEYGTPINPYDLFEGKMFALHIVKKMQWNNYDNCEFIGERTPLVLEGKPIQKQREDMEMVTKWLKENSPELNKYAYKEWTSETEEKVLAVLRKIMPDGRALEQVMNSSKGASSSKPVNEGGFQVTGSKPAAEKPSTSFDQKDFFGDTAKDTPKADVDPTADKTQTPKKGVSSLDDLYNDL